VLAAVLAPAASGDPLAGFTPAERQLLTDHLRQKGVPLSKVHTLAKEDGIVIPGCMEEEDLPADEEFEDLEGKEDAEYLCKEEEKPRFEQCELDHGCHHSQLQHFSGRDICRCLGVGFRCGVEQCRLPPRAAQMHCCVVGHIAVIIANLVGRPTACHPNCLMTTEYSKNWIGEAAAGTFTLTLLAVAVASAAIGSAGVLVWRERRRRQYAPVPVMEVEDEGPDAEGVVGC